MKILPDATILRYKMPQHVRHVITSASTFASPFNMLFIIFMVAAKITMLWGHDAK